MPQLTAYDTITMADIENFRAVNWRDWMTKPHMPRTNKSGNKLRTKDMIQGSGKAQKHPFSYGFKADSSMAGKRKIRKTK